MARSRPIDSILACLCGAKDDAPFHQADRAHLPLLNEKPSMTPRPSFAPKSSTNPRCRSPKEIAAEIITLIRTAEKTGLVLAQNIDDAVGTEGWTEWIAQNVLSGIEAIIKEGKEKMGPAMAEAYDKAAKVAEDVFQCAKDHPMVTAGVVTIIAVGVLVYFSPITVEALGFAELGPVEGSFAAWWQSTYAGSVPAGSLFSFFQRLGMIWGRA